MAPKSPNTESINGLANTNDACHQLHVIEAMEKLQAASDGTGVPAPTCWDRNQGTNKELEWINSEYDCSFKIVAPETVGYWHAYSFLDDTFEEEIIDLNADICKKIQNLLAEKFRVA